MINNKFSAEPTDFNNIPNHLYTLRLYTHRVNFKAPMLTKFNKRNNKPIYIPIAMLCELSFDIKLALFRLRIRAFHLIVFVLIHIDTDVFSRLSSTLTIELYKENYRASIFLSFL